MGTAARGVQKGVLFAGGCDAGCARAWAGRLWGGAPEELRPSAHRWAVARPSKSSTAEIRAHPDFRVKNIEKYVSLRSK